MVRAGRIVLQIFILISIRTNARSTNGQEKISQYLSSPVHKQNERSPLIVFLPKSSLDNRGSLRSDHPILVGGGKGKIADDFIDDNNKKKKKPAKEIPEKPSVIFIVNQYFQNECCDGHNRPQNAQKRPKERPHDTIDGQQNTHYIQESEYRPRQSNDKEEGSRYSEVGSRYSEAGSRYSEEGSRYSEDKPGDSENTPKNTQTKQTDRSQENFKEFREDFREESNRGHYSSYKKFHSSKKIEKKHNEQKKKEISSEEQCDCKTCNST